MKKYTFGFIGFGLIGGSIAKALKKKLPDCTIYAYMRSHIKLEMAKEDGIVDVILDDIDTSFSHCDLIFLCTPVEYNAQYLEKLKPIIHSKCIITDVGSTKSSIHESVKLLGLEKNFIGGHPMAGSEKTGYENSDELLLENAYYILTPTKKTREKDLDTLTALTKLMGAIPFVMDCAEHDKTVATISHLPHLVAAALVNLVKETDNSNGVMKQLAAGGFKDITRIASSSPIMWEQICETNREAILKVLDIYLDSLKKIRDGIKNNIPSTVYQLFEESRSYRNSISDNVRGLISAQYSFSVQVADRPGSISIISAILAANSISIKNIGINHNRELGEGALRIAFYGVEDCHMAAKLLKSYHYNIIERG